MVDFKGWPQADVMVWIEEMMLSQVKIKEWVRRPQSEKWNYGIKPTNIKEFKKHCVLDIDSVHLGWKMETLHSS